MKYKHFPIYVVTAVIACLPASMLAKKTPALPAIFGTAHTVFVETSTGGSIADLKLTRDDRNAILDMQDEIQDWGRYTLSPSRSEADLILVIFKGHIVRSRPDSSFPGARSPASHSPIQVGDASQDGSNTSGDLTEEKDSLRVYTLQPNGKLKGPIWSGEVEGGLLGSPSPLLRMLKTEVENAYPLAPKKP